MNTQKIQKFLLQALAGFIFWTLTLTPYMVLVIKTSLRQYLNWIGMQLILVPILAPLSVSFILWFVKKISKE